MACQADVEQQLSGVDVVLHPLTGVDEQSDVESSHWAAVVSECDAVCCHSQASTAAS